MLSKKTATITIVATAVLLTTAATAIEQTTRTGAARIPIAATTQPVKIRAAADTEAKILDTVPAGTSVKLSCWRPGADGGRWYWLANGRGYVAANDVRQASRTDYCVV
ncbi:SH3 domain-containing protein [Streptomyces boninensis]|uniref:SH3 domain-containing protein n=1 Tax=Streptomyces boninensis TaxID=2039455 RepID=UPI003B21F034